MRFRKTLVTFGALTGLCAGGICAYGYWHAATHGVLYVDVQDSAGRFVRPPGAELTFRADGGRPLAQFATDDARVFFLSGVYSCRAIEIRAAFEVNGHDAYAQCFERQSRWVTEWARDVTHADVTIGGCRWNAVPVRMLEWSRPSEWLLWWVPLPHAGGFPYTQFQATITIDMNQCRG